MTRICSFTAFLLAIGLAAACTAQEPPQVLLGAVHCLASKRFLSRSKDKALTFGYFIDRQSYPCDEVIYIVAFAAPARSNGSIFAVFLTPENGREHFNVQNNATFVLSKHEPIGVSFVDPPLGGTWTQEHLASAIRRIEKQPRYTVPVQQILGPDPESLCRSYTDH